MYTAINCTRYVQVHDGGIAHIAERGNGSIVTTVNINIQRMTVTLERTSEGVAISKANGLSNGNVGFQASVDKILAFGGFYHIAELVPVLGRTDGNKFGFSQGFLYP